MHALKTCFLSEYIIYRNSQDRLDILHVLILWEYVKIKRGNFIFKIIIKFDVPLNYHALLLWINSILHDKLCVGLVKILEKVSSADNKNVLV